MVGVVSLLTDLGSEMLNPLLPLFLAGLVPLGWAAFYVGLYEGIAETTAGLLKIVSGRLSDATGRRKGLMLAGYLLSSVCRPLLAFAGTGAHVVALKFGDRVGKGIRTAPRDALLGENVAADARGLAFGFHRAMDHAGAVLGPLAAAGILALLLGKGAWVSVTPGTSIVPSDDQMAALRWLFGLSLLPGLAAVAAIVWGVRDSRRSVEPASSAAPTATSKARLPVRFYLFVVAVALFALGNSSDMFLLLIGWQKFGLPLIGVIGLWVALHLAKMAFSIPGGWLSDRVGRGPLIVGGWLVYAAVYLGFSQAATVWQFCGLFVAYGLYYGMTEGAEKALVADLVGAGRRGTAFGIYHGVVGLAALPASIGFGWLWTRYGPAVAFSTGAALACAASLFLGVVVVRTRDVGSAPSLR